MFLLAAAALTPSACAADPMYEWGSYQDSLYVMWVEAESFDPGQQLAQLTEEIERAESEQKAVPPGVRAHVGWLLASNGNEDGAARMFEAEKAAFPEAAVFVDGLLARMGK